jgi:ATP-binding cassette subfamily B protein
VQRRARSRALPAAPAAPGRWGALLGLVWRAGRARAVLFAVLTAATGLLPTAAIVATGALLGAIPAAVRGGLDTDAGRPAVLALGALLGSLALLAVGTRALTQLARRIDAAVALEAHQVVAEVTLGTPGLAPLDDPELADQLQAVHDAERRGVLRQGAGALSQVATTRLRGLGAAVVLTAFHWWAPLALAAAWALTNRLFAKATENGISFDLGDGAVRLRRAEYLRSLALESPAAKEVRVFGLGDWLVGRYGDAWLDALGVIWKSRRASLGLTAATLLALAASHLAVLGVLGQAALDGRVGAAALLVFVQAAIATADLGMIGDPQFFLSQSLAVAGRVAALRERAAQTAASVLPARGAGTPGERASAPGEAGDGRPVALRLDDVRFTYRGRAVPTLDGLTLHVPAGQSLAIVGENGAGKSTLIKLLCGLYEPDAGRVTVDGGLTPAEARGRVAVIFQDFVRYPLTLRENVAFGHRALATDTAALAEVLADAGGEALPARLPRGWDTVLSREFEGGADLSGGQWQRIALARALAAVRGGAGLLILDEPTASLDVRAETELFERFLRVTRGVTTILVSHRLSSVRHADRIVVVEGGRVVEDGTHRQLMAAGAAYAQMYTLQAERFAEASAEPEEEVAHA